LAFDAGFSQVAHAGFDQSRRIFVLGFAIVSGLVLIVHRWGHNPESWLRRRRLDRLTRPNRSGALKSGKQTLGKGTIGLPWWASPHFRRVRHAIC
jgi:hypothetical protein